MKRERRRAPPSHPAMMAKVLFGVFFWAILCPRGVRSDGICAGTKCSCSHTASGQVSASCLTSPDDFQHLVSLLPPRTVEFKANLYNPYDKRRPLELGAADFSRLKSLKTLHICTNDTAPQKAVFLRMKPSQVAVLWPLENLQELKININWMSKDVQDMFIKSKKLRILDLSDTPQLDLAFLSSLLTGLRNSTSLKNLTLRNIQSEHQINLVQLPLSVDLRIPSLVEIDISQNELFDIDTELFTFAPKLEKFNASDNLLSPSGQQLFQILMHPALQEVDFSAQRSLQFENTENVHSDETRPASVEDDIQERFSKTQFRTNAACINALFEDFCNIYLSQCDPLRQQLTHKKDLWCDLFRRLKSWDELDCEFLPPASTLLNAQCPGCLVLPLVGPLRRLHLQNMRRNDELLVEWLTEGNCFHPDNQLEFINLSNNALQNFNLNIQYLRKLSTIDLSGNMITSLSVDMTKELSDHALQLENATLKIDLSGNPLECSCHNRDFTNWVVDAPENIVFLNFKRYRCIDEDLREVLFHRLRKLLALDCLSNNAYIGIGVGGGVIISVILTALLSGIYRKRWLIRYNYFLARQLWRRRRRDEEQSREYTYDVFVCYNDRDDDWVSGVLKPKLEDELGIKLCLHYRDFQLGNYISDMVIESIENSRKTLLILSPHFVQSLWCMFEMRMAHQKFFSSGQDVLLLAMFKPLGNIKISKTLKALLERKNYVEWADDEYGQKLFWARLIAAFDLPSTHSANRGATNGTTTADMGVPILDMPTSIDGTL